MTKNHSNIEDELGQMIADWADSIIQSAKQLMFNGKAYLIAASGLPWYYQGDVWVDDSWWVDAARSRYEQFKNLSNRWIIDELEILVRYFPSEYSDTARLRIEQWHEESSHDPENWWELARIVYPQHSIFQELHQCPENYSELAILASLGYEDIISGLRKNLLTEYEHQDWFWVSNILSCICNIGGLSLTSRIVSDNELQQIRQTFVLLAEKDLLNDSSASKADLGNQILSQTDCIRTAVRLGWQDVIDPLAKNNSYLRNLSIYDILWWSLTDKKQLVESFIVSVSPHTCRPKRLSASQITSESMALAISWKRATSA